MAKKRVPDSNALLPKIELGQRNLILFGIGVLVIVAGYALLAVRPWDNPVSLTAAPLVLLVGYLIVFPVAIFIGGRATRRDRSAAPQTPEEVVIKPTATPDYVIED